ncbi:MAG: HAD-IIIA family hydrolase [Methylacidiphilales bacterium]|nr:HAD-IIIA family hydrolase [Candidatus Methylacidiphilales bacterium]
MKQRAVFFDRDDTLMVNVPYLGDPTHVEIFPEAAEALYALRQAGFLLFVVSNQSGVGRGLITRGQVSAVDAEMKRQLKGDYIHAFYHSFAAPDDPYATDRKPSPELLLQAAKIHDLDLAASFFIGDRLSDIECGINAGCRTVLLAHKKSSRKESSDQEDAVAREKAHYLAATLTEAANWILEITSPIPVPKTHEIP